MAISSSSSSSSSSMATMSFLPTTSPSPSLYRGSSYSVLAREEDEPPAVKWHENPSEAQAVLDVKGTAARASDLFECSICTSEFNNSEMAVIPHTTNVQCAPINNQKICTECLDRWRQLNNTCPFCRDPLQAIPLPEPSRMKRNLITTGALFGVIGLAATVVLVCLKSSDII